MNKITLIIIIPVISLILSRFESVQELTKTGIWSVLIIFIAVVSVSVFVIKLFKK